MQQQMADTSVLTAVAASGYAWVATAQGMAELAAVILAAGASCFAAYFYYQKARQIKEERNERATSRGDERSRTHQEDMD